MYTGAHRRPAVPSYVFFFSSRRRHTRWTGDWSSDVCSSDLGGSGLGKPLKLINEPLRKHIPIYIGAEGPKNIAMVTEIADGWLPLYYSPYRPRSEERRVGKGVGVGGRRVGLNKM